MRTQFATDAWSAPKEERRSWSTLVELARARSAAQPDKTIYTFLSDDGSPRDATYGEIDRLARRVAGRLQKEASAGARAILLYPPGIDFVAAYLGCLYAGVVAVPCYPPGLNRQSTLAARNIALDCEAELVLTSESWARPELRLLLSGAGSSGLTWIATDSLDHSGADGWREPDLVSGDLAFLQYTSGTTGDPKGVMVTHGNLIANLDLIRRGFSLTPNDRGVIWLPPYHDMGLIGGILAPLYCDFAMALMAPTTFLRRPLAWLQAISDRRATAAGGPNFAFEMCVRAARNRKEELALDLSSWEIAFTGAEMIRVETMERFVETFSRYGFQRSAIASCYGMAEATLMCTASRRMRGMVDRVDRDDRPAADTPAGGTNRNESAPSSVSRLAGCGAAPAGAEVRIVDPDTFRPRSEGRIGEIWISGPSVAKGYWGRPELTQHVFGARLLNGEGPFLRSGDRGFLAGSELYVVGRYKDLIIIRGRNFGAEDIEESLRGVHPALKPHRTIAFSAERDGAERLVVSVEHDANGSSAELTVEMAEEIARLIRRRVLDDHGLAVDLIVVLKPKGTPLTTSGKLRRRACREDFLAGTLPTLFTLEPGDAKRRELAMGRTT
jgi:acyl-CoA synthetase (AMP-forming)/AMP-acid ligase II